MGFMEDIGRSNALSGVNSLLGKAIEMRQMDNQSAEKAYTLGMEQDKMGLLKAEADRSATKFGWEAEAQAKKKKFDESVVSVDSLLGQARPGSRERLIKLGQENGWIKDVGGNLVISRENMANAKTFLNERLDITSQLALTDVADISKEMGPLRDTLNELRATKPDDKQIPIIAKRLADLDAQKTQHLNSVMELDKAFQEKKALAQINRAKLGTPVGDSESGDIFYNSPAGLVTAQGVPYDAQAHGNLAKVVEPVNTINEFQTFYRGYKENNPKATEGEISAAWSAKKAKELESRIPPFSAGTGLPPGYVLNRRTGGYEWKGEGPAPGMSPEASATYQADKSSLQYQTKMTDMMKSFVGNMNAQVDRLSTISKDVQRMDTRLLNVPIRDLKMKVAGSAIEAKVGMYLTEISNEIGKLSTGSQASVRELSESAQKKWEKIHDPNLSIKDLLSLLNETKHAGAIRLKSAQDVISQTKKRLGGGKDLSPDAADPYGIR